MGALQPLSFRGHGFIAGQHRVIAFFRQQAHPVADVAQTLICVVLAVEEAVLDPVPGARETYRELLRDGIQEYVEISGAA